MNRVNPRVLGIIIVLGGLCAALPFQKLANRGVPAAKASNVEGIEWRSNDFTLEVTANSQPLTGPSADDTRAKSPAFGGAHRALTTTPPSLDNLTQPPALAGEYESEGGNPETTRQPGGGESPAPGAAEAQRSAATSPLETVSITHKIADGDTLEALAEKFLGSRLRWTEIYNANPELLDNPEVLPLGVTIVILPRMRPTESATTPPSDALVPVSSSDLLKFREASD